jgi:hypothetical protein
LDGGIDLALCLLRVAFTSASLRRSSAVAALVEGILRSLLPAAAAAAALPTGGAPLQLGAQATGQIEQLLAVSPVPGVEGSEQVRGRIAFLAAGFPSVGIWVLPPPPPNLNTNLSSVYLRCAPSIWMASGIGGCLSIRHSCTAVLCACMSGMRCGLLTRDGFPGSR